MSLSVDWLEGFALQNISRTSLLFVSYEFLYRVNKETVVKR